LEFREIKKALLRVSFTVVLGRYLMGMKRKKTKNESLKFL
jgi:hypothetical protein